MTYILNIFIALMEGSLNNFVTNCYKNNKEYFICLFDCHSQVVGQFFKCKCFLVWFVCGSPVHSNHCDFPKLPLPWRLIEVQIQCSELFLFSLILCRPFSLKATNTDEYKGHARRQYTGKNCVSGIFILADEANKGCSHICMSSVCRLCRVLMSPAISGESGCLCLQPAFIKLSWPALYI